MKKPVINGRKLLQITGFFMLAIGLAIFLYLYFPLANYYTQLLNKPGNSAIMVQSKNLHNELYIPKIHLKTPIVDGSNISVINNNGVWLKPVGTQTPFNGGNTVVVGHSFTINNPNAPLYNLDKLSIGSSIYANWMGNNYKYNVVSRDIVSPSDIQVEANSQQNILTIYTCYPRFSTSHRLVIVSTPAK